MRKILILFLASALVAACRQSSSDYTVDHATEQPNAPGDSAQVTPPETPPADGGASDSIPQEPIPGSEQSQFDFNLSVLNALKAMPAAGGYETSAKAMKALKSSARLENGNLIVDAGLAHPSFCSGATYLVFLKALVDHFKQTRFANADVLDALLVKGQSDGAGIWGRWNANGPGTARFLFESGMGKNFDSWKSARPGDFMKIFWNNEIGKNEKGHSVVFLAEFKSKGVAYVRYWSSNQKNGMGIAEVKKSSVKRVIFSRVTNPDRINQILQIPASDSYLAEMLTRSSSPQEMADKIALNK